MGLKKKLELFVLKRWLKGKEKGIMGDKFRAIVGWLNAVPGRKRGVAAVLLAGAAALRAYGHSDLAEVTTGINDVIQNVVVPGVDLVGCVMALVGVGDAVRKRKANAQ